MPETKINRHHCPESSAIDEGAGILFISVDRIRPNRAQPRHRFDTNTMIRLADSVRRYGILQPLTVRPVSQEITGDVISASHPQLYELIAGERRLRAAKLAGLTHVPCILTRADDPLSAELAVIENLLREDLNMFEQARAFGRLILQFSLTQEQVARKMSMSQSAVANKLRLLRLSEVEQRAVLEGGLSERHARALLRLPPDSSRKEAICYIVEHRLNVAATEEYIERLRSDREKALKGSAFGCHPSFHDDAPEGRMPENRNCPLPALEHNETKAELGAPLSETEGHGKKKLVLRDLRLFYNSLEHAVEILKQTGLAPRIERYREDGRLEIRILVEHSLVSGRNEDNW